jgi:hydroxymethylpyrimidine/phosphomethylpyrimidine kinase
LQTVALTIAGSDPSGGAGVQADLKIFHQFGVYGEAVLTLLTVQNTRSVVRVQPLSADLVRQQIEAVIDDIPPRAAKTGALGSREIVETVAELAGSFSFPLVVDPVMISTHGKRLLPIDAIETLKERLLPHTHLVTPNIREAELLTGVTIASENNVREATKRLLAFGCRAAVIKGGHSVGEPIDYLLDDDGFVAFPGVRVNSRHTHGTGCVYSAAITACLAEGYKLRDSVGIAKDFVRRAIETAPGLGTGSGPLNHFVTVPRMAAPRLVFRD